MKYAILYHPGHNRVYFQESRRYSAHELTIVGEGLYSAPETIQAENLGGIPYLTFQTDAPLTQAERIRIGGLSFFYALFEVVGDALRPVPIPNFYYADPGISSMLKYTGKTNELFTRLMINLALAACAPGAAGRIALLDPLAGKGTTLFEGFARGYDVAGIEVSEKAVGEAAAFFKRYLATERFKHTSAQEKVSGPKGSFTARRHMLTIGRDKGELKSAPRTFEILAASSAHADKLFKKGRFHLLVADLPYGVQHGNVSGPVRTSRTRSPEALLEECLPSWHTVLKKGGAIALSWNTFLLSREKMAEILARCGFYVLTGADYEGFEHRVDQSIRRDLIVARKDG